MTATPHYYQRISASQIIAFREKYFLPIDENSVKEVINKPWAVSFLTDLQPLLEEDKIKIEKAMAALGNQNKGGLILNLVDPSTGAKAQAILFKDKRVHLPAEKAASGNLKDAFELLRKEENRHKEIELFFRLRRSYGVNSSIARDVAKTPYALEAFLACLTKGDEDVILNATVAHEDHLELKYSDWTIAHPSRVRIYLYKEGNVSVHSTDGLGFSSKMKDIIKVAQETHHAQRSDRKTENKGSIPSYDRR